MTTITASAAQRPTTAWSHMSGWPSGRSSCTVNEIPGNNGESYWWLFSRQYVTVGTATNRRDTSQGNNTNCTRRVGRCRTIAITYNHVKRPDRDLLMNNSVSTERISTSPRTVYKLFTTLARCCVLLRDRTFSRTGHRTTVLLRQLMAEDGNRIVVVVVVVVVY